MVLILKRYIEAERGGNWQQHLAEVRNMLPFMVSAGHSRYVACVPHYLEAMTHLPQPIKDAFEKGNFTIHETNGKFNGV